MLTLMTKSVLWPNPDLVAIRYEITQRLELPHLRVQFSASSSSSSVPPSIKSSLWLESRQTDCQIKYNVVRLHSRRDKAPLSNAHTHVPINGHQESQFVISQQIITNNVRSSPSHATSPEKTKVGSGKIQLKVTSTHHPSPAMGIRSTKHITVRITVISAEFRVNLAIGRSCPWSSGVHSCQWRRRRPGVTIGRRNITPFAIIFTRFPSITHFLDYSL